MNFSTIMVHLELGRSNLNLLNVAAELAERCQSKVVGLAAAQPLYTPYIDAAYISGEIFEQERKEFERESGEAEAEFRSLLTPCVDKIEWRCAQGVASLADHVAREARSSDLILVTAPHRTSLLPEPRRMNLGDFVMKVGRPTLLVPANRTGLRIDRMMVAWKDGRESRRAVLDALPMLELASHITVVEIASEQDRAAAQGRLVDVVRWLEGHGISAEPHVEVSQASAVTAIAAMARTLRADVVVAGAYGHSRLREWIFGGVTMDLLMDPIQCTLLSH